MLTKPLRTALVAGVFGAGALAGTVALTPASADNAASTGSTPAATSTARGGPGGHANRPQLTDEQQQCMTDAGIVRPETRPEGPPTTEQRVAIRAAAESCGIELPARGPGGHADRPQLTDEQQQCMTDAGIVRPETRPEGPPTAEQRVAIRAAAESCGIELPARRPCGLGPSDGSASTESASSPN